MLQKTILFLFILITASITAHAVTPVRTLVEQGKYYDGSYVEISGEVIGDIMKRGNTTWINVLSPEGVAIGVLCPTYLTTPITILGNYKQHGDEVLVRGTFHRFYKEQGGETAITGYELVLLRHGYPTPQRPTPQRILASILLLLIGITLWGLYVHPKKR